MYVYEKRLVSAEDGDQFVRSDNILKKTIQSQYEAISSTVVIKI